MLALEPIEEMRDYREDDVSGKRLFVTGLASSIDDVRLYLAFEGFGRIVEAHVAKPGLGFVVFDDTPTADDALAAMEGSEVSGKEIKVKRARSYYIRKEEEARLRIQSNQREREERTKLYASEQTRRLKEAEEVAFQQTLLQNKGLAHHLQNFDARAHREAIAADMEEEGLMPELRGKVHDMHSEEKSEVGRVRMRAARRGPAARRAQAAAVQEVSQEQQVLVGRAAEEEMLRRAAVRQRRAAPLSLGSVLAPDSDGRTLSAKDEERIRKQAMIEIMKEGDKLSKTESKNLRPENINIAHLIRQRVEQIRRYEMLRDNKELLEQITFTTSNPTSRCIDPDSEEEHEVDELGMAHYARARDSEWNVEDEEDEDDGGQVTETEEELIAMISAQAKIKDEILMKGMKFGPKKAATNVAVAAGYQQNGFSNNIAAGMSSSKAAAHSNGAQMPAANGQVDLNGAAAPPVQKKGRGRPRKAASERKTYVPTGRPRGRPRKKPE